MLVDRENYELFAFCAGNFGIMIPMNGEVEGQDHVSHVKEEWKTFVKMYHTVVSGVICLGAHVS